MAKISTGCHFPIHSVALMISNIDKTHQIAGSPNTKSYEIDRKLHWMEQQKNDFARIVHGFQQSSHPWFNSWSITIYANLWPILDSWSGCVCFEDEAY